MVGWLGREGDVWLAPGQLQALAVQAPGRAEGGAQTSDGWSGGPRSSTGEMAGQTLRGLPVCLSAAGKFKSWVWCQLLQGPLAVKSRVKVLGVHRKGKSLQVRGKQTKRKEALHMVD